VILIQSKWCATGGMLIGLTIQHYIETSSFTEMSWFVAWVCRNLGATYRHDPREFTSNMHNKISNMAGQDANYLFW